MHSRVTVAVLSPLAVLALTAPMTVAAHGADATPGSGPAARPVVTVTAADASMPYGGDLPDVAASYQGLPDGVTEADLDAGPTCVAEPATRTTSCSGAADADLDFVYVDGVLAVTPVPLRVVASDEERHGDEPVPVPTPIYRGLVNGDRAPARAATCVALHGVWVTRCSGAADEHYVISYVDGTYSWLVLGPAPRVLDAVPPTQHRGPRLADVAPVAGHAPVAFAPPSTPADVGTAPQDPTPSAAVASVLGLVVGAGLLVGSGSAGS